MNKWADENFFYIKPAPIIPAPKTGGNIIKAHFLTVKSANGTSSL